MAGVLFALEEAATHWSQQLTWRTFFCAICSTGCLNLLLSSVESNGAPLGFLSHPGLITFGSFLDCQSEDVYAFGELLLFALIGVVCGLCGERRSGARGRPAPPSSPLREPTSHHPVPSLLTTPCRSLLTTP